MSDTKSKLNKFTKADLVEFIMLNRLVRQSDWCQLRRIRWQRRSEALQAKRGALVDRMGDDLPLDERIKLHEQFDELQAEQDEVNELYEAIRPDDGGA